MVCSIFAHLYLWKFAKQHYKFAKVSSKFCQILIKRSKKCQRLHKSAKVAKFSPIWSHWFSSEFAIATFTRNFFSIKLEIFLSLQLLDQYCNWQPMSPRYVSMVSEQFQCQFHPSEIKIRFAILPIGTTYLFKYLPTNANAHGYI